MEDLIKIAICDDDSNDLKNIKEITENILKEKAIKYEFDEYSNPCKLVDLSEMYDIIFLDVEMELLNGIETGKRIKKRNKDCVIFFVTNHGRFIDDAFDIQALRFWEKPLDNYRVERGIESALKEIYSLRRKITIRDNDEYIQIANIIYIQAENKGTRLIMHRGALVSKDSYKTIFDKLSKYDEFVEICRGCCVNMRYIDDYDRNKMICSYGKERYILDISRRKYENVHINIRKWIGGNI